MRNIIMVDGHDFKKVSDGLYKTDTIYEIDTDWGGKAEHENMTVVGPVIDGVYYAQYISTNSNGKHEIVKIANSDFNNTCCMEGIPTEVSLGVLTCQ